MDRDPATPARAGAKVPPSKRYTKGGTAKPQDTRTPARRRGDSVGPMTRAAANQPVKPKLSGSLRHEILIPIAVGSIAAFGALGIVAAAANKLGLPVVPVAGAAALVLLVLLMGYVAWIVHGAASRPERASSAYRSCRSRGPLRSC